MGVKHLHLGNCNSPILGLILLARLLEQVHPPVGWPQELIWFILFTLWRADVFITWAAVIERYRLDG